MSNPATYNFEAYYGDTYGLVFVFTDANGDPLDILSTFTELTYDIFTKNKEDDPLVSLSLVSGFTVTDGNKLVGAITAEQNETLFGSPIKYAEMRVVYNGTKETLVKGTYIVNRAQGSQGSNDSPLTLAIDLEAIEVTISLSDSSIVGLSVINNFLYDTPNRVKEMVTGQDFQVSNIIYSDNGNIQSADLLWVDGQEGSISNLVENPDGAITSIRFNRPSSKYITYAITYNSDGSVATTTLTPTGY